MISNLQKQLLQQAATRSIDHPGSIQNIFYAAASMGDEDTVMYIYANYFTAQYFEPQAMQHIQQVFMHEAMHSTIH
jgi:dihydroxyacetone kinase